MTDERVIGVIPAARMKTGFFGTKPYTIVVTNERLLFAEMTNELVKRVTEEARAKAKEGGKGFFGQWGAQLKTSLHFGERYAAMDPTAILAETPGNYALGRGELRKVSIDEKTRNSGSDDAFELRYLHVTVETPTGKQSFDTDDPGPGSQAARGYIEAMFAG